jgi:hypothetical protein
MPRTEAQKRAQQKYLKKWRETNRERYNAMQNKYQKKYNANNREKIREYAQKRYYALTQSEGQEPMTFEDFLIQFDGEILTDSDDEGADGI